MKRIIVIAILMALVVLATSHVTGQDQTTPVQLGEVVSVVDGDTIDVDIEGTVYRVRYIGINTPESNETCGDDATAANRDLVLGKPVALQRDVSETDQFDRLLRYVYVDGLFVNASMVIDGWAEAVEYPPDTAFAEWFGLLESEAAAGDLGCHPTGVFGEIETLAQGVTVTASNQVNLRTGPGTNYPVTGTLSANQTATAIARNAAGDWLVLESGAWIAAFVVTVEGDVNTLPVREAPPVPDAPPPAQPQPTQVPQSTVPPPQPTIPPAPTETPVPGFTCDCRKTCGAMASCEEAYFQLQQCGCSARDGDGDGVPCESICPGG